MLRPPPRRWYRQPRFKFTGGGRTRRRQNGQATSRRLAGGAAAAGARQQALRGDITESTREFDETARAARAVRPRAGARRAAPRSAWEALVANGRQRQRARPRGSRAPRRASSGLELLAARVELAETLTALANRRASRTKRAWPSAACELDEAVAPSSAAGAADSARRRSARRSRAFCSRARKRRARARGRRRGRQRDRRRLTARDRARAAGCRRAAARRSVTGPRGHGGEASWSATIRT